MPVQRLLKLLPAVALAFSLGACRADVEREGELPEVDVEGGQAPRVDVEPADVDVTTDTQQVVVPDVDVDAPRDTL